MNRSQVHELLQRLAVDPELERDFEECAWKHRDLSIRKKFADRFPHHTVSLNARFSLSHDELINYSRQTSRCADVNQFARGFVCSTNTARPKNERWAGALRSLSLIYQLPKHSMDPSIEMSNEKWCEVCGCTSSESWDPYEHLPSLLGGFAGDPYFLLDHTIGVRYFNTVDLPEMDNADIRSFKNVLRIISDAPSNSTALQLKRKLESEGDYLDIETLGFAGILNCDPMPGIFQTWVRPDEFQQPSNTEMRLPACRWRRKMGFNRKIFKSFFPDIPLPRNLG